MAERLDDTALMLRYRDGDIAAFETLYRRHKDSLYRYLLRLSADGPTSEDLLQETWSKIIRARDNYRPTARFSTYLFRVAHNSFIDHLRRNRIAAATTSDDPDQSLATDKLPDAGAEQLLLRRRLERALRDLPIEQRDAYLLREEAGFGVDEIAAITGVKRETAKSRLALRDGQAESHPVLAGGIRWLGATTTRPRMPH